MNGPYQNTARHDHDAPLMGNLSRGQMAAKREMECSSFLFLTAVSPVNVAVCLQCRRPSLYSRGRVGPGRGYCTAPLPSPIVYRVPSPLYFMHCIYCTIHTLCGLQHEYFRDQIWSVQSCLSCPVDARGHSMQPLSTNLFGLVFPLHPCMLVNLIRKAATANMSTFYLLLHLYWPRA
jgi:hypothetical protein